MDETGIDTGRRGIRKWREIRGAKVPPDQEAAQAASTRALRDALSLRELRTGRGITQVQIAERLGKSQGNVSELERRDDVYLSSLREYVEALGGRLEISAVFEDEHAAIPIDLVEALDRAIEAAKASARADAKPVAGHRSARTAESA
jgi:transcriptional regulator with XRE-family HTH domain